VSQRQRCDRRPAPTKFGARNWFAVLVGVLPGFGGAWSKLAAVVGRACGRHGCARRRGVKWRDRGPRGVRVGV